MNQYERNYHKLSELLQGRDHVRIDNEPYMPLVVERIEGTPLISQCHYGEQNGDLMRDPEVVFLISETTDGEGQSSRTVMEAKPVYYRNDYLGHEEATIEGHFGDVPVKPRSQNSLDSFCQDWWRNIAEQGYFEKAKELTASQTTGKGKEADASPDVDTDPEIEF
jgi:hypothetical protein